MPMIASYVHRADVRSLAFFREAVISQAEELVHVLFNKPSVICYAVHPDPPWTRSLAWLGPLHTAQLHRDLHEKAPPLTRPLDAPRPLIARPRAQHLHSRPTHARRHRVADVLPH